MNLKPSLGFQCFLGDDEDECEGFWDIKEVTPKTLSLYLSLYLSHAHAQKIARVCVCVCV